MRLFLLLCLCSLLSIAQAQEIAKDKPVPAADPEVVPATVLALRDANQMLAHGDTDGALAKINATLEADPRSINALLLRGAVYIKKKMYDKAYADYEASHLINPHSLVVQYDLAEVNLVQKRYDQARAGFVAIATDKTTDLGDLAGYKAFLCDLFGGHQDVAAQELAAFQKAGEYPSYYFSNAAWDLVHHNIEDARGWLVSASNIYPPQKNGFYASTLAELGYLPLPPPKE